jgi:manganese transport protein
LVLLMRRPAVMGQYVTGRRVGIAAIAATTLVLALNLLLVLQTLEVPLPGLG